MREISEIMDVFAYRLFELIQDKGWNIQKFSKIIKLPRTTINSWLLKTRSPKIDNLCALADFFGVSVDYLLGRED